MKENVIQLLIGIGLMVGCAIIAVTAAEYGVFSSTMASWVQGIGTVVAIFIAVRAARAPFELARHERERERRDFIEAVEFSVDNACHWYNVIRRDHGRKHPFAIANALDVIANHSTGAALDRLLEAPLKDWPSSTLYTRCEALRGAMQSVTTLSASLRNYVDIPENVWRELDNHLNLYDCQAELVREVLATMPR